MREQSLSTEARLKAKIANLQHRVHVIQDNCEHKWALQDGYEPRESKKSDVFYATNFLIACTKCSKFLKANSSETCILCLGPMEDGSLGMDLRSYTGLEMTMGMIPQEHSCAKGCKFTTFTEEFCQK